MQEITRQPRDARLAASALAAALLSAGIAEGGAAAGEAPEAMTPKAAAQDGPLQVGDRAPAFPAPLPSTAGERPGARAIALEEVLGNKNIVLAFYVADWTGG